MPFLDLKLSMREPWPQGQAQNIYKLFTQNAQSEWRLPYQSTQQDPKFILLNSG